MTIISKCCVCGAHLRTVEDDSKGPGISISHGYCKACYEKEMIKIEEAFATNVNKA